jgi:hypothetical protein
VTFFLITLVCCLAVGGPAVAQTVGAGRIQVLGRGSVERTPDHAVVQVGIANKAATPTAALDENSAIAGRIIAFAKTFGVGPSLFRLSEGVGEKSARRRWLPFWLFTFEDWDWVGRAETDGQCASECCYRCRYCLPWHFGMGSRSSRWTAG